MKNLINLLFHDIYKHTPDESGFPGASADRYKLSEAHLLTQLRGIKSARSDSPVLVTQLPVEIPGKAIPFTISVDDGGISYHSVLADHLEENGWRGHCLITTKWIGHRGFLDKHHIQDLHARGHLIGTHTVNHPQWINHCSWEKLLYEWQRSKAILEDIIGESIIVGSVPGGYYSPRVASAAQEAGLEILFTSEPECHVRRVNACSVLGRYTLRHDSPDKFSASVVSTKPATLLREWATWNGKKVLKNSLGSRFETLSKLIHRSVS